MGLNLKDKVGFDIIQRKEMLNVNFIIPIPHFPITRCISDIFFLNPIILKTFK